MAGLDRPADLPSVREQVAFYLVDHRTALGKAIDVGLLALNLVFIAIIVLETYPLPPWGRDLLWALEVGIALVFLVEYLLRLYGAPDRWAEFANVYSVVDVVSILPTLAVLALPGVAAVSVEVGLLRLIRVFRVLRFFRFTKDEEFFFGTVSLNSLRVMKLVLTVLSIFFLSAGLFYGFEHDVNPAVDNFGDAFYFTVVALTTVGFGDIIPVTDGGRFVTVSAIIVGIIVIPWQVGKIVRQWTARDQVSVTCPECGLSTHDRDASHCKACGHVIYQEYSPEE